MILIFLYFLLFLVVHYISKQFKQVGSARLFQLVTCFVLLFGFFGFRDITVLNDTSHYYGFYYEKAHIFSYKTEPFTTFHLLDKFEYGFQIFVHILIQYVSKNPYTIIIVSSFIITIGELWIIDKYARDIAKVCFFMLVASFFFTHYCVIRQALAILFFYGAYRYLEQQKTGKYYLLILCAGMFHYSAFFLLVIPILMRLKPTWKNATVILGITVLLAAFLFEILSLIGLRDHPYYQNAIQKDAISIIGIADLVFMCIILSLCMIARKLNKAPIPSPLNFWICIMALCICLIALVVYPLSRINEYLWPFILFLLLRYIDPTAMRNTSSNLQATSSNNLLRLIVVIIFASRLITINTIRPEWLHIDDYKLYDFSKTHHNYNLYPQE